jgi:hypothetical protein
VISEKEDQGLGLPEKKNCSEIRRSTFHFFLIFIFLTVLCTQINPVSTATSEATEDMNLEGENSGNTLIIDFFSDHNLSDTTVRFKQPFENASLVFTLSSGKKVLKSETFVLGPVEKEQEVTKVLFWGLEEDYEEDGDSYTAQLFVKNKGETLDSSKVSFTSRNPTLSKLKLIDFSADSEKASVLITLTSSANLRSMQAPEPGMIDLDLKLLSDNEIVYLESQENIPVTDVYYKPTNWPLLLEKNKKYTALLKVHSHSPDITTVYRSDFRAEEKVEILDQDIDVDEYGASVTIVGKSQVPFDGIIRTVLTPEKGETQVFEETADILTAGKEDTVGIIWQGVPKGDYNVKIYVLNLEGEVLDSHETVLRVFEPVTEAEPVEESPASGFFAAVGIFLFSGAYFGRKK